MDPEHWLDAEAFFFNAKAELASFVAELQNSPEYSCDLVPQNLPQCQVLATRFYKAMEAQADRALWAKVARILFCAPASSSSSERLFSASGLVDTHLRSLMAASTLEKLTVVSFFLKKNKDRVDRFYHFCESCLSDAEAMVRVLGSALAFSEEPAGESKREVIEV